MADIIFVDDELENVKSLEEVLKSMGHNVDLIDNGKIALEQIQNKPPDIIFLDIKMSPMSGLDVLEEIRKTNKKLPVIMLTGFENGDNREQSMALGASGYLVKPIKVGDLLKLVNDLTSK